MQKFGVMPVTPDVGLDAVDIVSRGEVHFSINRSVFSESLGSCSTAIALDAGKIVSPTNS